MAVTARYWRLSCYQTASGFTKFQEVAFLSNNFTDLSVGGTAFASSELNGSSISANAFDKSTATVWSSLSEYPAIIGYDHGTSVSVEYVLVRADSLQDVPLSHHNLKIEWSSDNVSWTKSSLKTVEGGFSSGATTLTFWSGAIDQTVSSNPSPAVTSATPSQVMAVEIMRGPQYAYDMEHGGLGVIYGVVQLAGSPNTPLRRRVRLLREPDGMVLREVWSNPATGAYSFTNLSTRYTYSVMSSDYEGNFRPEVAERVVAGVSG